ncbi:hypothetical protein GUJ93_ZPchr0012g21005 [Zizania palustris]|uniref:Uncharacterized protein n=1 Tax=Zizania palustris TaxID=103762 RepID=A0A8J5WQ65_ZIZPA|nr:hypothetical protein GUJ93_ZPchr0012g21005 [Zizania palustris]
MPQSLHPCDTDRLALLLLRLCDTVPRATLRLQTLGLRSRLHIITRSPRRALPLPARHHPTRFIPLRLQYMRLKPIACEVRDSPEAPVSLEVFSTATVSCA